MSELEILILFLAWFSMGFVWGGMLVEWSMKKFNGKLKLRGGETLKVELKFRLKRGYAETDYLTVLLKGEPKVVTEIMELVRKQVLEKSEHPWEETSD